MKTCECGGFLYLHSTQHYKDGTTGTRYKCKECKKTMVIKADGTVSKNGRPPKKDWRFLHTHKKCQCGGDLINGGTGKRWMKGIGQWKFSMECKVCKERMTYYTDEAGIVQRVGALPVGRSTRFEVAASRNQQPSAA